jgi:serine/threonine protein kinase
MRESANKDLVRELIVRGITRLTIALATSTELDGYEILDLLSAGGMGEVYRARDPLHRYCRVPRRKKQMWIDS